MIRSERPVVRIPAVLALVLGLAAGLALAADPPDRMHYQGVLRDASDAPLDGDYDMVFRFWSADVAGDEILVDRHVAVNTQAVTVAGGLFSVQLGTGEVLDGSGPGTYTTLSQVFGDYGDMWLEVQVGSETLSPRIPVAAAGWALNAGRLAGRPAGEFLDTSSATQTKMGKLAVDATGQASYGIEGAGDTAGGWFRDADGSGYAYVGIGDVGIEGHGAFRGGFFSDSDSSGYAYVGNGDTGIVAYGNIRGGSFHDRDSSGYAYVGTGDTGIEAYGNTRGGYFKDRDGSGYANVGIGDVGIRAYGNAQGGYFKDLNQSGYANVGIGDVGIEAYGTLRGGYFADSNGSGYANVGTGDVGIEAYGILRGGHFSDSNDTGYAYVGNGDFGIRAYGSDSGGYFKNTISSGYANVGARDVGIEAYGNLRGGYFKDSDSSGYAYVAIGDRGIHAYGNFAGGYFEDLNSGTYLDASVGASSTRGNGAKNFVQNHPYDPTRKIVYTSLEGNEAGTYVRGSARLVDGAVRIPLDETFAWVTNPDVGLTVQLTPRGRSCILYVTAVGTEMLEVLSDDPACAGAAFDYLVQGLRIGFEGIPVVQPKEAGEEAPIPSMAAYRALVERQPELVAFTPLERFRSMPAVAFPEKVAPIDLSRARALVAAIHEFDPAVDATPDPEELAVTAEGADPAGQDTPPDAEAPEQRTVGPVERGARAAAVVPVPEDRAEPASPLPPGAVLMTVTGPVEPGVLLTLDSERSGSLRTAASAADPGVVGVAAGNSAGDGAAEIPVLTYGIAEVRIDAGYGSIRPGDLLTSSPTPGHAMRAIEVVPGTLVGKAIDGLDTGTGRIRVLLMAR
ncbi:MAG: hypothetical protein Q9Q40_08350 [Acidobacteriota bacterium]|nr:hypothetical protein [Acidobacteriota bacterium]